MSQVKSSGAGVKSPGVAPRAVSKASRVNENQIPADVHALLSQFVNRAGDRAHYSSVQRFEFLEVPALAHRANCAQLANG